MREKILTFIEKNSRIDLKELSVLLGISEIEVANAIAQSIQCNYVPSLDAIC